MNDRIPIDAAKLQSVHILLQDIDGHTLPISLTGGRGSMSRSLIEIAVGNAPPAAFPLHAVPRRVERFVGFGDPQAAKHIFYSALQIGIAVAIFGGLQILKEPWRPSRFLSGDEVEEATLQHDPMQRHVALGL